jgi:hypothetical protein
VATDASEDPGMNLTLSVLMTVTEGYIEIGGWHEPDTFYVNDSD